MHVTRLSGDPPLVHGHPPLYPALPINQLSPPPSPVPGQVLTPPDPAAPAAAVVVAVHQGSTTHQPTRQNSCVFPLHLV